MPTNREIAEALSGHRFEDALHHVAADAEWVPVGDAPLHGAEAIAAACRATAADLAETTTEFVRFDVVDGGDAVVVDAVGVYTDASGDTTAVSSCDLYRFHDGLIVGIRSYTVEVAPDRM